MKEIAKPFLHFDGNGEVRALLRELDWSVTSLGHPRNWPQELLTVVNLLLDSKFPSFVAWGPELGFIYNDAYALIMGDKHPGALGHRFQEIWGEIWSDIKPIIDDALAGHASYHEDLPLTVLRKGYPEQASFTFSYSPVRDNQGVAAGMYCTVIETTKRLLSERRHAFQLCLADSIRPLTSPEDILAKASELLGQHVNVARVLYSEIDDVKGTYAIRRSWARAGMGPISDKEEALDDFGPEMIRALRSGYVVAVEDIALDARTAGHTEAYLRVLGIRSFLCIPVLKSGRLSVVLNLHHVEPHRWNQQEIELAQDMVERTWAAAENAYEAVKRREAEEQLRDKTAKLQFVMESAQVGDWSMDLITNVTTRSIQHDRCFGYSEPVPEWSFGIFIEHVHPDDREYVKRQFQTAIAELIDWHFECRVIWPDKSVHWIAQHGSIYHTGGEPTTMVGIVIDITERKRAEEELLLASRRKDEFLAMLAHELRNPLAPISSGADLLKLMKHDVERVHKTSDMISRQVQHMTHLVDDLLDVSRVTRGLVKLDQALIDIRHVVTDAVEQVTPLMQEQRHHLTFHLPPESTVVTGDKKRLVQVISNILTNAAKYTPQGGRIQFITEVRGDQVWLSVSDNGIGMTPELAARAFDIFTQAERSSDRSQGGLGLGLSLVKSLVELHGGTVSCSSAGLGKGSTFSVSLPRAVEQQEPSEQPQLHSSAQEIRKSLRVMIVDDNVDAAQMLAMLLEALGHQVIMEHESRQALERVRNDVPDVCLLDIGLPEIDGNELARRLRRDAKTANIILIAVTGYGQEHDREAALTAGFDHHLVKPVDTPRLISLLNEISAAMALPHE